MSNRGKAKRPHEAVSPHEAVIPTQVGIHDLKRSAAFLFIMAAAMLSGCTEIHVGSHLFKKAYGEYTCKEEGDIKVGSPYRVDGVTYTPMVSSLGYSERGIASWYGDDFHGKASANGECYNMYAYTAAHKTLPLPTIVRVTNLENNKSIVVKVNDRGPFVRGRIIDLSYAAAQSLDIVRTGTAPVLVEAIGGPSNYVGGAKGNVGRMLAQGNTPVAPVPVTPGPSLAATAQPDVTEETLPDDSTKPAAVQPEHIVSAEQAASPLGSPMAPVPAREAAKMDAALPQPVAAQSLPPPPAQPAAAVVPLVNTSVYVQVGAFGNPDNAARELTALKAAEPTAFTSSIAVNGATLTRVRAGPYNSVAEAEAALDKLVSAGFNGARIAVEPR
jgi:rare lipoprotein A